MHPNRLFNVFVIGALAAMSALTIHQALATAEVITGGNAITQPRPYRSPLDECFDVPLKDAAACRQAREAPAPTAPATPVDVCFDVALRDACDD